MTPSPQQYFQVDTIYKTSVSLCWQACLGGLRWLQRPFLLPNMGSGQIACLQGIKWSLIVRLLGLGSLVVSPLIWFRGCVVCLHEHVGHIIPILVMLPQCQV